MKNLKIVNVTVAGPVLWVITDRFWLCPYGYKVVGNHDRSLSLWSECQGAWEPVLRVWFSDGHNISHAVHRHLFLYCEKELTANLVPVKSPVDLATAEIEILFFKGDEVGLFVAKVEGVAQSKTRDAVFPIECRDHLVFAKC